MLWIFAFITISTQLPTDPRNADLIQCVGTSEFIGDRDGIANERALLPPGAWQETCRQARDAEARRASVRRHLVETGKSPIAGFSGAVELMAAAREAKDPEIRELLTRAFQADFPRESFGSRERSGYAGGLSPLALKLVNGLRSAEAVAIDRDNTRWLADTVRRRGWFDRRQAGDKADLAAWLITQHSDASPVIQKELIDTLEPVAKAGGSSMARFATLYDRWAAATGAKSRYGLQGKCVSQGRWEPLAIEDSDGVDRRRQEADLPPLAQQVAENSKRC